MMNRTLKSAKLDFYSANNTVTTLMLLLGLNVIISFLIRNPMTSMTTGMLFATTASGLIFIAHNGSHGGKLYGILPLRKHEIVVGRYIYGMIIGLISLIFAYILSVLVMIVFNMQPSFESMNTILLPMAALMFIFYCLIIGVSYPLYFALGYKTIMVIPPVVINLMFNIYAIPFIYTMKPDSPGWIDRHFKFFAVPYLYLTVGIGFAIGLALIVISVIIAYLIYRKKEI